MERITPQALFDLFIQMSDDDCRDFIKRLGEVVGVETLFFLLAHLPIIEQQRFCQMVATSGPMGQFFLLLEREARRLARDQPDISDDEFDRLFHEHIKQVLESHHDHAREVEQAILKQDRDRKSDPDIIKRNVEICDLRRQDPKNWTQGKLAKHFDITPPAIRKILKTEAEWRRKAAALSTN